MKTVLIIVLVLGVHISSFSQSQLSEGNNEKKMKSVELPEIVIRNAGKDFSYYLPDKNPDPGVQKLQSEFIAYNLGKDYEGYDNFLVILEGENGMLTATYDSKGKLTSVVEKYSNTKLLSPVS